MDLFRFPPHLRPSATRLGTEDGGPLLHTSGSIPRRRRRACRSGAQWVRAWYEHNMEAWIGTHVGSAEKIVTTEQDRGDCLLSHQG